MTTIGVSLQEVHLRIRHACAAAQRPIDSVSLLAVSKTITPEKIREAHSHGQHRFGENYVQEALVKMAALRDLRPSIEWHLIGPLQSNKAHLAATHFDWVHSVDSHKLAQRLNAHRRAELAPLNVCLQVNISDETSKNGLALNDVGAVAHAVTELPRLRLRGLMAIPQPANTFAIQRKPHCALRELLASLSEHGLELDTLSMGMSTDLEAAITEGATMVRIGTAIFGQR